MTHNDKIAKVKILVNDSTITDEVIGTYLDIAKDRILNRLSPYKTLVNLPSKYDYDHIELTSRYILKRGAEGQISSKENGIVRNYASVDEEDILSHIVPYVGV